MCVNMYTCKYVCLNMRTCPEELSHLTVLFLATILSNFLAIRTSSSAGPMAGAPPEQDAGCGHSWALLTWGSRAAGWEGAERRGKGGKGREGKRREGRESRKEVGLSRPVINSCQESKIARGRAKYSREPGPQQRRRRALGRSRTRGSGRGEAQGRGFAIGTPEAGNPQGHGYSVPQALFFPKLIQQREPGGIIFILHALECGIPLYRNSSYTGVLHVLEYFGTENTPSLEMSQVRMDRLAATCLV